MKFYSILLAALLFAAEAQAAINVAVTVTRVRCQASDDCPAPRALFFDATATSCDDSECASANTVGNSFQALDYIWDFDDPTAGNWKTGAMTANGAVGQNKNVDYGPITFHVYDNAGTYQPTVTVTDGTTTVVHSLPDIVIDDPDVIFSGTTHCYRRTATNWTGCPDQTYTTTDASSAFDTLIEAEMITGCGGSGCRRFLFQDGGSYSSGTIGSSVTGPLLIGTFGTGGVGGSNRVSVARGSGNLVQEGSSLKLVEDWTLWNLDVDFDDSAGGALVTSTTSTSPCYNGFLSYQNSANDTVEWFHLLRCDTATNSDKQAQDVFNISDGQILNGRVSDEKKCHFLNIQRFVLAGVEFGNNCERHLRTSAGTMSGLLGKVTGPMILAHNTHPVTKTKGSESIYDIRGVANGDADTGDGGMRYVLIADELFQGEAMSLILLRTNVAETRNTDIIIERNRARGNIGSDSQGGWIMNSNFRRLTIRNNLVVLTNRNFGGGILYQSNSDSGNADVDWIDDTQVLNNSVYSDDQNDAEGKSPVNHSPITFVSNDERAVCKNNIWYTAFSTTNLCDIADTEGNNASRNAVDQFTLTESPFVGTPAVGGSLADWALNDNAGGGAELRGTGAVLQEVLRDFSNNVRSSSPDIGALDVFTDSTHVLAYQPVIGGGLMCPTEQTGTGFFTGL